MVHTHSSKAGILGRAAAWDERVPAVVHTIHGLPFGPSESPLKNRLYVALERWAARRCHAIVSVCDAMTEQALAAGVGRPEQYHTVYSGMDVEAFLNPPRPRDEVRRELGLADDEVAFGTVARLFERKGHDDILAAAPAVLAANPQVRFVFIGDGILRDRLIAETERLGLRHAFHFVGLVPPGRIPELLGAMDAVVHPSLREGLARVLPQALLVGRPVISYDVDGAREVVLPGDRHPAHAPRHRRPDAPRSSGSPPTRRFATPMGQEGRRRFADQFRHETMTAQLRSLYERAARASPRDRVDRAGSDGGFRRITASWSVCGLPLVEVEARRRSRGSSTSRSVGSARIPRPRAGSARSRPRRGGRARRRTGPTSGSRRPAGPSCR